MIKLPSQDTARRVLAEKTKPYESVAHRKILLNLSSGSTLVCAHCGFTATRKQIQEFYKDSPAPTSADPKQPPPELAEGWGLFRASAVDMNPWSVEASNFELVCVPCFHASHAFIPGFEPVGKYGLLNVMSQVELIYAWRALMLGSMSGKPRAVQPKELMRSLIGYSEAELIREISGTGGAGLRLTNVDLCYWIGYAGQDIHKIAPKVAPDLRFLPSLEPSAYGAHLPFCHRFTPIFPPEAIEAQLTPAPGARIEPTLESTATA